MTVDVTAAITAGEGQNYTAVAAAVQSALEEYFSGQRLGERVLLAKLGSVIYAVDGVENYAISAPAADVDIDPGELPVLGTVTLSNGEA